LGRIFKIYGKRETLGKMEGDVLTVPGAHVYDVCNIDVRIYQ
jgi:hypothetical protein